MSSKSSPPPRWLHFLRLSIWFGIVTGLVEGLGLLLFQHLNWQNWGRMIHVSTEILWISPIVDVLIFGAAGVIGILIARLAKQFPILRITIFFFVGMTVYDWLTVTDRLWHFSCLLLAVGAAVAFDRWSAKRADSILSFCRRTSPWLTLLLVLVFGIIEGGNWWHEREATSNLPAAAPGAPNVLVVIFDALRADHVSSYGYPRETTPNIDRLASEGALFENAVATASWSLPSHVSLVTGRYPYEHGAEDVRDAPLLASGPQFSGQPTLGQVLQARGYRTGAFSGNRVYFTHDSGFQRAFMHFEDYFYSPRDAFLRTLYGREFLRLYLSRRSHFVLHKRADVINAELLRWIDREPQRPFLAYLNYFDVHDPYGGPPKYPKPAWELKTPVDNYDAGLAYDNDMLARLVQELERRGLSKNTLLILTSDHGESLGQHALFTHSRALYWELLHVPLVIWYPGHVPANTRVGRPVTTAAIPATVLDLIDPVSKSDFPGPSLARLWHEPATASDWPMPLSEIARNPYPEETEKLADQVEPTSTTGWMKSLVTPQWHLIVHEHLGTQLYDWIHDPEEKQNQNDTPEGKQAIAELTAYMRTMLGNSMPPGFSTYADSASLLHAGSFDSNPAAGSVNDHYRIKVTPGSQITVEVQVRDLKPSSLLDPVLVIQNAQGDPMRSCRNPGDDHLRPPAAPDPTPDAFDDLCLNDDSQPGQRNSKLEFSVPASSGPPLDLYVQVINWNPKIEGPRNYRLILTGVQ